MSRGTPGHRYTPSLPPLSVKVAHRNVWARIDARVPVCSRCWRRACLQFECDNCGAIRGEGKDVCPECCKREPGYSRRIACGWCECIALRVHIPEHEIIRALRERKAA